MLRVKDHWIYVLLLMMMSIATFFVLNYFLGIEFFVKDDNSNYLLPQLKLQGEMVFNYHQIPQINYFAYLGHPLLEQAQTGVFYLPRYLFYLIAAGLHNFELLLPIEGFFHILLAGVGLYVLLICLGVSKRLAVLGAYAYAFNGFLIEIGRNWLVTIGYFAYMPFLYLLTMRVARGKNGVIYLALIRAILFFLGHVNFFAYVELFEIVLFILLRPNRRDVLRYLLSWGLTVLVALPAMLPVVYSVLVSTRNSAIAEQFSASVKLVQVVESFLGFPCREHIFIQSCASLSYFNLINIPILIGFIVLFRKYTMVDLKKSVFYREAKKYFDKILVFSRQPKYLIYLLLGVFVLATKGGILLDLMVVYLGYLVWSQKLKGGERQIGLWVCLFLLGVGLAMGPASLFTFIFFPVVVLFRWPFKWYLLVQLFLTIAGILFLQRIVMLKARQFVVAVVAVSMMCPFILVYFSGYHNELYKAYSEISDLSFVPYLKDRYVGVGQNTEVGIFTTLLVDNAGAYFHKLQFGGYDPLVSAEKKKLVFLDHLVPAIDGDERYNKLQERLDSYGVRQYVVLNKNITGAAFLYGDGFEPVYRTKEVTVFNKKGVAGVVTNQEDKELNYSILGNEIEVKPDENSQTVILRFMKENDNWRAYADGVRVPVMNDEFKRLTINLPRRTEVLTVKYHDLYMERGVWISLVGLGLFGLVYISSKPFRGLVS